MSVKKSCFVAALLTTMSITLTVAQAKRGKTVPSGGWGGTHIQLTVANGSASIEYDCATGTIDGPLKVDSRGRFDWRGKHVREHGGPVRINENSEAERTRYTGWTDGKRMKLTVILIDSKTTVGTFELTRASEGRVFKCR